MLLRMEDRQIIYQVNRWITVENLGSNEMNTKKKKSLWLDQAAGKKKKKKDQDNQDAMIV